MGSPNRAVKSDRRTDQDQRTAFTVPDEMRDRCTAGLPDAGLIDVDQLLPRLRLQPVRGAVAGDAGICDDDVQPPELSHGIVEELFQAGEVTHVPACVSTTRRPKAWTMFAVSARSASPGMR